MRIFGIVLIAISTVLFGVLKTNSSKIRPISLQKFIACISKYKTELSWHQKSFKEIILKDNFGFDDNYYQNVLALLQDEKLADAFINKNECYAKLKTVWNN